MTELIDIIIQAVDDATATFESIVNSAEEAAASITGMGDATGEVDSTPIEDTKEKTEETKEQADETTSSFDNLNNVIQGLAGAEAFSSIADGLMAAADAAGTYEDSMMRAGLEAEGAGISADTMANTFSHLSDETGRAGGQIREAFITATARGITDTDSFTKMMEGAGAQATLFGTDIQSMGNKFSQMAMRSTLMERGLASTGITMEELATAMGMTGATADEVKAKWSELDANQRAAILGTAASMNEGEEANAAYKESWAGLQEQIETGKGRLLRLVGEVLLPVLIPAMELATRVMDWLGDTFSAVMDGPLSGFISVIGAVGAGIALAVPAIAAIQAGLALFSATIWPAVTASWALLAPWLPWIALGAAIVAIIYGIGKAFGWWTDAGSMIDAIWAGLQRLWSAFINHPDVQAAISMISSALSTLWSWIQQAGQAILEFFGIAEGGDFDIVLAIMEMLGAAWDSFKWKIQTVISVVTALWNAINTAFNAIWSVVGPIVMEIVRLVQRLIFIWELFKNGQMSLPQLIIAVLSQIGVTYSNIMTYIVGLVVKFAAQMLQKAIQAGRNFVNGIINRIKALPGQIYSYLVQVVGRIGQAITLWKNKAYAMVRELISKVTSPFTELPGKISGALSGVVNAISKPFQDAWNYVKPYVDKIQNALNFLPSFGGEAAYGGETAMSSGGQAFNINTGEYVVSDNQPLVIEDNVNISLDLQNVPATINTDQLISALQDRSVLSAIAGNRDFQALDANVKKRISLRNARRG